MRTGDSVCQLTVSDTPVSYTHLGSVSKYLAAQFKGLITVARGIAIVAKGMGSTFLTVGRMMITVIRAVGAAAVANPILIVIAAVIAGLYLLLSLIHISSPCTFFMPITSRVPKCMVRPVTATRLPLSLMWHGRWSR